MLNALHASLLGLSINCPIDIFNGKSIDEELDDAWAELLRPKTKKDWKQFYYLRRKKKRLKYLAKKRIQELKYAKKEAL